MSRIGVDCRFLTGGPNVMYRGTGRYTLQQLREVVRQDQANEYWLVCHPHAESSLLPTEIRAAPNVRLAPHSVSAIQWDGFLNRPEVLLENMARFQDWLYRQRLDLSHLTRRTLRLPRDPIRALVELEPGHDWPRQLVQAAGGFGVAPLHVALRETPGCPVAANDWARPSELDRTAVERRLADRALAFGAGPAEARPARPTLRPAQRPRPAPVFRFARRWVGEYLLQKVCAVYCGVLAVLPGSAAARLASAALRLGLVERL